MMIYKSEESKKEVTVLQVEEVIMLQVETQQRAALGVRAVKSSEFGERK